MNQKSKVVLAKWEDCTGCMACVDSCKFDAIEIINNKAGFKYPVIDYTKCRNCGTCTKKCTVLNKDSIQLKKALKCAAAKILDDDVRDGCTSGGLCTALAKKYLEEGDLVYGASFIKYEGVKHIRLDKLCELPSIKGSKYVQSDMHGIFKSISNDLKITDKNILFIGTPCQVASIEHYFKNERITTVSFICGGVMSSKMLFNYLNELNIPISQIKNVIFREKQTYLIRVQKRNSPDFIESRNKSAYLKTYDAGYTIRESCEKCIYCTRDRPGDITLGDFWGIEKTDLKTKNESSMSCVISSTSKGLDLLCSLPDLLMEPTSLDIIGRYNFRLDNPRYTDRLSIQRYIFKKIYGLFNFHNSQKLTDFVSRLLINKYTQFFSK